MIIASDSLVIDTKRRSSSLLFSIFYSVQEVANRRAANNLEESQCSVNRQGR